jgi:hypothetical protein
MSDPQNCGSARNEKGMFTTTYPGKADTMNAAQMQSLGEYPERWQEGFGPLPLDGQHFIPTVDRVVGRTRQEVEARVADLLSRRDTMRNYMKIKYAEEDWHGVQDAGSDLRDIDAELVGLRWVLGEA